MLLHFWSPYAKQKQPFPNLFTAILQVALLGHSILKIGSGTDTRYNIMTAWFVMYTMGQSSPTYF